MCSSNVRETVYLELCSGMTDGFWAEVRLVFQSTLNITVATQPLLCPQPMTASIDRALFLHIATGPFLKSPPLAAPLSSSLPAFLTGCFFKETAARRQRERIYPVEERTMCLNGLPRKEERCSIAKRVCVCLCVRGSAGTEGVRVRESREHGKYAWVKGASSSEWADPVGLWELLGAGLGACNWQIKAV